VSGYQRAVVWKPTQQAALIRSLLYDYPTGLIVLNRVAAAKPLGKSQIRDPYAPRIEIIDGQQRLTTIFDFLANPMVYATTWAPRLPTRLEEPKEIRAVREAFDALYRKLKRANENYAPSKTSKPALIARIASQASHEFGQVGAGKQVRDPRFHQLVDSLVRLDSAVRRRHLVIQLLGGLDTSEAERIYDVINSSGTRLRWWELLWGKEEFVHTPYPSPSPYRTERDVEVERVTDFKRVRNAMRTSPIKAVPTEVTSLWHAMYALGNYCNNRFSMQDPRLAITPPPDGTGKPKVDGLGFRLVSTFLSHDVGRASVYDLLAAYSPDQIRRAIDILFDTADTVFDNSSAGAFQFFIKYAYFDYDAIPAYPLVGLFVAASKFVAINKTSGAGVKLTSKDTTALRALAEEMFRDAICTSEWSGAGDTRLRQWMNAHFECVAPVSGNAGVAFPGAIKPIKDLPKGNLWLKYIASLDDSGRRTPDRRGLAFHFWVQYVLDASANGTLPKGQAQFDHIVPFNKHYPATSNLVNVAAISSELNRSKGGKTYAGWEPSAAFDQRYRTQVMCQSGLPDAPAAATADFLQHANFSEVRRMIDQRREVLEYAVTSGLRKWMAEGD
jgi:uncharacterized protein DUF262